MSLTQRYTPIIPPTRPPEPETLVERYHLDLAALATPAVTREEFAIRRRGLAGGRLTPRDLMRLAACQAQASREEGGR